jgi:cystathionine beta-lyase
MQYDFDKITDRHGTGALKIDALKERYGSADLLPLWVADMDFETPYFITEALQKRLGHSIFGYTVEPSDYWPSVIDWIWNRHQYGIRREWLSYVPGVVKGIGFVIQVFTHPGDKVIIQPPVYHPFRHIIKGNNRVVVNNPLKEKPGGGYEMDFKQLESIVDDRCKVLVVSNPHNPAGIVWDVETLRRLAAFCHHHHIIVISDEIHCDMALFGNKHHVFTSVSVEAEHCGIVFGAPTKTFNIAGVVSSYAIIPDEGLRKPFYTWLMVNELNEPHLFAPIATIAAFRNGEEWRRQMLGYVEDNVRYVEDYCRKYIPNVKPWRPQASFLVWLDCRALGLNHASLVSLFVDKARLALNDGEMFGQGGQGFMRLNVGSPRSILTQALKQLSAATDRLSSL